MARVKIDFRKPVPAQVSKSRDIQTKMTGNPYFPVPVPSLAAIKTATDELENSYLAAINNDREMKALMRIKRKALHSLISELADYVKYASAGNEEKIISSGFDVWRRREPVAPPDTPNTLKVKHPLVENELSLVWKPSPRAKYYIIQVATGPDSDELFKQAGTASRALFTCKGLAGAVKYWFRVMAVNANGTSGWSQPGAGRTL